MAYTEPSHLGGWGVYHGLPRSWCFFSRYSDPTGHGSIPMIPSTKLVKVSKEVWRSNFRVTDFYKSQLPLSQYHHYHHCLNTPLSQHHHYHNITTITTVSIHHYHNITTITISPLSPLSQYTTVTTSPLSQYHNYHNITTITTSPLSQYHHYHNITIITT